MTCLYIPSENEVIWGNKLREQIAPHIAAKYVTDVEAWKEIQKQWWTYAQIIVVTRTPCWSELNDEKNRCLQQRLQVYVYDTWKDTLLRRLKIKNDKHGPRLEKPTLVVIEQNQVPVISTLPENHVVWIIPSLEENTVIRV